MPIQIKNLRAITARTVPKSFGLGAPSNNTSVFIQPTSAAITDLSNNHHALTTNCTFVANTDWPGKYIFQASGSNRWIQGPTDNQAFNLGTGSFTIEAIFQPIGNNVGDYGRIVGAAGGLNENGWALDLPPANGFPNGVRLENASNVSVLQSPFTFVANQIYHVAATRNGSTFKLFVNGMEIGMTTSSVSFSTFDRFQCFYRNSTYPRAIRANFYAIRVVKDVSLYNSNFTADLAQPMYLY